MEEKRIRRSIIFPASLYEKAKKQADREFRQISGLVVIAVEKYLEEKERGKKQNRAAGCYYCIYIVLCYIYTSMDILQLSVSIYYFSKEYILIRYISKCWQYSYQYVLIFISIGFILLLIILQIGVCIVSVSLFIYFRQQVVVY